ncbi:hypothetical protein H1Z61_12290 [Bacillus aquiflavi]|uniref:Group-specific protein n=1 Tax=Bacillus aquiflavi TaxID=2672567 RepID=A0A6B3W2G1_9BACI|nr:hypothetical protein [Bacillus aquiflavi]MBA4537887.1 hypothetical protein [Bacillus aquiflavi]NEY82143.1 hypothetical protein [Bacillus aquiflavi]
MVGETFVFFRPIFYLLLIFMICHFAYFIFLKRKIKGKHVIMLNSFFLLLISLVLLFQEGIIVDHLGLGGDPITFYITLIISIIFFVGFLFYGLKKEDS